MRDLYDLTLQWARDRYIIPNAAIQSQALKLGAELSELAEHLAKNESIKDDVGDILVVLTVLSGLKEYDLIELVNSLPNYHKEDCFKMLVYYVGELQDKCLKNADIEEEITNIVSQLTCIALTRRLTLEECWNEAYNDIKDRKGVLTKEGVFVKSTDTEYERIKNDMG